VKIVYVKGDIKIGNINFQYVREDTDNVYCRMGQYSRRKKIIYVVKQSNIIITMYIIIHEFIHALINYTFKKHNEEFMNKLLDKADYIFKKYVLMYRPEAKDIIKI